MTTINQKAQGQSGYIFFYNRKQVALYADNLLDAKNVALAHFRPPTSKRHLVHGMIAEDSTGACVVHSTASI